MTPVRSLGPRTLTGRFVTLEPLEPCHHEELRRIGDAEPELWRHMLFDGREGFAGRLPAIAAATAAGTLLTYAVRRNADGALCGSTAYMAIVPEHARLEIGTTWYVRSAQGTAVNPECKLLLMANAFAAGYHRVEFKTDALNARSRAALAKLGAREEGILRGHMWTPRETFRDTVYFSVLADEWPAVRDGLERRILAFA